MDRRRFLQLSLAAPLFLPRQIAEAGDSEVRRQPGSAAAFPTLDVTARSYREVGYQIGKHLGTSIRTIIKRRKDWHDGLLKVLQSPAGRRYSRRLQRLTRKRFPHYLVEVRGMAEGAGIAFDAMWAMTIKSELASLEPEPPGCSTLSFTDDRSSWLLHNEDGHVAYADQMWVVRVRPPGGVGFVAMVYPGILTGNGPSLNSRGIVQTTNYIGSERSEEGLPRYVIGRAILEAETLQEAEQIATLHPRAYPYHHNLASFGEHRYLSVETVPGASHSCEPSGLSVHTNHLLYERTRSYEYEDQQYRGSSSLSRYRVLSVLAGQVDRQKLTPQTLLGMLSLHDGTPYSPCRHPQGEVKGQTLGTALYDLRRGLFRLYRGNPCQAVEHGRFVDLTPPS